MWTAKSLATKPNSQWRRETSVGKKFVGRGERKESKFAFLVLIIGVLTSWVFSIL
jgi:hypothetical protein